MKSIAAILALALTTGTALAAPPVVLDDDGFPFEQRAARVIDATDGDVDVILLPADRGRKDAQEILLPQPAYGPSVPSPFCGPSSPVCP